jgi:hypothetical protein
MSATEKPLSAASITARLANDPILRSDFVEELQRNACIDNKFAAEIARVATRRLPRRLSSYATNEYSRAAQSQRRLLRIICYAIISVAGLTAFTICLATLHEAGYVGGATGVPKEARLDLVLLVFTSSISFLTGLISPSPISEPANLALLQARRAGFRDSRPTNPGDNDAHAG